MQHIIYESSITGIFRLLLIIVITYYAFTLIFRYIVPILLKNYVKNVQQNFTGQNQQSQQTTKKEGEVTIQVVDEKSKNGKKGSDDDYVDFEEVKE